MSTPPFLDLPASVTAATVPGASGPLAALVATPPPTTVRGSMLLVPGFTGSKEDFIAILEPLAAAGWYTVAFDMRGQYESAIGADDVGADHFDLATLADDVTAVARWLASRRRDAPVHLLGHSYGGLVTRAAVLRAWRDRPSGSPEGRVAPFDSLILLDSGPAALTSRHRQRAQDLLAALGDGMTLADIWQVIVELDRAAGVPPLDESRAAFLEKRWMTTDVESLAEMCRQLLEEPDRCAELAEVSAASGLPILVACGVDDDYWDPDTQHDMAARLGARFVAIDDAGHSPAAELPERTARLVLDFVEEPD